MTIRRTFAGALATLLLSAACAAPHDARPLRIAVHAGPIAATELSTRRYGGGFETKTLVYETLVRRDARGALAPDLAAEWRLEQEGRIVVLRLRPGARFHDGTPVTAADVAVHMRRWVGLPEHAWLRASDHIVGIEAVSEDELRIELDEPRALLPELCAINPGGVCAPGMLDREGDFVAPLGSGPFRFEGVAREGELLRYRRADAPQGAGQVELVRLHGADAPDPLELLRRGAVDVVADGWEPLVSRAAFERLRDDARFTRFEAPGSVVVYASFRLDAGPTARTDVRRAVRAAIDRAELVREVERGHAEACREFVAATVEVWPRSAGEPGPRLPIESGQELVLVAQDGVAWQAETAAVLARQLRAAGFDARVRNLSAPELGRAVEAGAYDVRIESTWGVPYDPYISLCARFLPPTPRPSAASERSFGVDPRLRALVERVAREPAQDGRTRLYGEIQQLIDDQALIVPLYVPRRLAVVRTGRGTLRLDHDLYRLDLSQLDL
jgi:ABC-type transport system substrate-binding protein